MTINRRALTLMLISAAASPAHAQTQPLSVGQVWSVKGLSNGRATIGRIESFGTETAVHISLVFDAPPDVIDVSGALLVTAHLPFTQDAVLQSIDTLISEGAAPAEQFEEGYRYWREAASGGAAGAFTLPIAEVVETALLPQYRNLPRQKS